MVLQKIKVYSGILRTEIYLLTAVGLTPGGSSTDGASVFVTTSSVDIFHIQLLPCPSHCAAQ
jgi:hypothetical protein